MAIIFNRLLLLADFFIRAKFSLAGRYFLFIIGYQDLLPRFIVKSILIQDDKTSLVVLKSFDRCNVVAPIPKVRERVCEMLLSVIDNLPKEYGIEIVYAYRSLKIQNQFWNAALDEQRILFPEMNLEDLIAKARRFSAEPTGDGPHQTGGAIDVVLIDRKGNKLVMGTEYRENNHRTPMFSHFCKRKEMYHRKILRTAMVAAGFWYYPGEWWHYSYGDQMWAAYVGERKAIYGSIKI